MFCLLTRFSVPPYRGASRAPAVGAGNGDVAIVGLAVGNGGAVGAMAGCRVAAAVGPGAGVGNGIVAIGIGGAVGAMADCVVADAATGEELAGAGNASPSSEHAIAAAAIAASVRIVRNE